MWNMAIEFPTALDFLFCLTKTQQNILKYNIEKQEIVIFPTLEPSNTEHASPLFSQSTAEISKQ